MSQLDSNLASGGVLVQKPRSNVYTVMLALSLVALLVGIFFLWLEVKAYNYEIQGPVSSTIYQSSEALAQSRGSLREPFVMFAANNDYVANETRTFHFPFSSLL